MFLGAVGPATGNADELASLGATNSIVASTDFDGVYALQIDATTTATSVAVLRGYDVFGQPADWDYATLWAAGGVRFTTLPASGTEEWLSFLVAAGTSKINVRVGDDGTLYVYAADGTTLLATSTFTVTADTSYRVGLRCGTGATARFDFVIASWAGTVHEVITGTGNLSTSNIARLRFGKGTNRNGNTIQYQFGNWVVDNQHFYPWARVDIARPDAFVVNELLSGTGTGVDQISDVPANDATYLMSDTSGPSTAEAETESCTELGIPGSAILLGMGAIFHTAENASQTSSVAVGIESNATQSLTTATNPANTNVFIRRLVFALDPATNERWARAAMDAALLVMLENNNVSHRFHSALKIIVWMPAPTDEVLSTTIVGGTNTIQTDWLDTLTAPAFTNQVPTGYLSGATNEYDLIFDLPSNHVARPRLLGAAGVRHHGVVSVGPRIVCSQNIPAGDDIIRVEVGSSAEVGHIEITYTGATTVVGVESSSACKANGRGYFHHILSHDINICVRNRGVSALGLGCGGSVIERCFVYNIDGTTDASCIRAETPTIAAEPLYVLGCSALNAGATATDGWTYDLLAWTPNRLIVRNCIGGGGSTGAFVESSASDGTIDVDYCLSDDATADDFGGANCLVSQTMSDVFVSASGTIRLHLKAGSPAIGAGTDITAFGASVYDIDEQDTTGLTLDMGADQFIADTGPDFAVQRGRATIASGVTTATITAGVDYAAPSAITAAFIRIVNTHHFGIGNNFDARVATAYISDPANLLTSITFERHTGGAGSTVVVDWEIVEYIGPASGANEFIVRGQGTLASSAATANTPAIASVATDADVLVWITGQRSNVPQTGSGFTDALFTSNWDIGNQRGTFARVTGSLSSSISYAVVEFTGSNWSVQRVEHTFSAVNADETEAITSVGATSRAFLHTQMRVTQTSASDGIDRAAWHCYLSDVDELTFKVGAGASALIGNVAVAWVIANSQTSTGAMVVTRYSDSEASATSNVTDITTAGVTDVAQTSVMETTTHHNGTGTLRVNRAAVGFQLTSATGVTAYRSDAVNTIAYRFAVVRWPNATGTSGASYLMPASPGAFVLTGSNVSLVYQNPVLSAESGSFTVTGSAAILEITVYGDVGTFLITGSDATLTHGQGGGGGPVGGGGIGPRKRRYPFPWMR